MIYCVEDESSLRDLMFYTLKEVLRTRHILRLQKGGCSTDEDFKQTFNAYKQRHLSV